MLHYTSAWFSWSDHDCIMRINNVLSSTNFFKVQLVSQSKPYLIAAIQSYQIKGATWVNGCSVIACYSYVFFFFFGDFTPTFFIATSHIIYRRKKLSEYNT